MRTIMRNPRDSILYAADGEPSGGGGAPEKMLPQSEVDKIVQARVAQMNAKIAERDALIERFKGLEEKLAQAEAEKAKAAEEAELKGKTEAEKLQHQMKKLQDSYKALEADRAKSLAEKDAMVKAAEQKHVDFVRRERAQAALFDAGVIKGASKHAVQGFLSDAEIELSEDGQISRVTVGGKPFDKPVDAAKEWLTANPYFAEPPAGGSGGPRNPSVPTQSNQAFASGADAFAAALTNR